MAKNKEKINQLKEQGTSWLLLVVSVFIILLSMLDFFVLHAMPYNFILTLIFFLIFIAGMILFFVSKYQLGEYYDINIKILADHQIVKHGLYKYVRHPMYFAMIIAFIGGAGMLGSLLGILAVFIFLVPSLLARIFLEEKFLLEKFGKEYEEYCCKTKKLIPGIW